MVDRPNQRWVADITEFHAREGKLYLAAMQDLFHRGLVGWHTAPRRDAQLVVNALTMALARTTTTCDSAAARRPDLVNDYAGSGDSTGAASRLRPA